MMGQYSKCAYSPYYLVSFHIVKAKPLYSIPCEVFCKIYVQSLFIVLAGGGGTLIYLQVCTFTL